MSGRRPTGPNRSGRPSGRRPATRVADPADRMNCRAAPVTPKISSVSASIGAAQHRTHPSKIARPQTQHPIPTIHALCRGLELLCIEGSIGELRAVLSKFFVDRPLVEVDWDVPIREFSGRYATLRDVESCVIAGLGQYPQRRDIVRSGLERIWKMICDPRAYSWNIRNLRKIDFCNAGSPTHDRISIFDLEFDNLEEKW